MCYRRRNQWLRLALASFCLPLTWLARVVYLLVGAAEGCGGWRVAGACLSLCCARSCYATLQCWCWVRGHARTRQWALFCCVACTARVQGLRAHVNTIPYHTIPYGIQVRSADALLPSIDRVPTSCQGWSSEKRCCGSSKCWRQLGRRITRRSLAGPHFSFWFGYVLYI